MKDKIAVIFPGQGSQSVGMGKEVADAFAEARDVFQEVDDALSQKLSRIIFEGSQEDLTLTENAQPAIMATSIAILRVIEKEKKLGDLCSFVAGHSLGEYTALAAAGSFSLADTARLLKTRGQAMQKAVPVGVGAMAAILAMSFEEVQKLASDSGCDIANDNADGQVVISGKLEAVEKAMAGAKKAVKLPVSAPFHSSLMQPAAEVMKDALAGVTIKKSLIPVIANVTASEVTEPEMIRKLLVDQVTGMVRWRESIKHLKTKGIENLVEIGAGKVLTGLAKRIEPDMKALCVQTPKDIEEFLKR